MKNTNKGIITNHREDRDTIERLNKALQLLNEAYELLADDWHDDAQDNILCAINTLTDDLDQLHNTLK